MSSSDRFRGSPKRDCIDVASGRKLGEAANAAPSRVDARRRLFIAAATTLGIASLASCGFHVRGDAPMAFRRLAVVGAEGSGLVIDLKRSLRGSSGVEIIDAADKADAVLYILLNQNDKSILTLSGGGRVREYQLSQRVLYRVADVQGNEWLAPGEINVRRDFSYNDSQALAKEGEERLLLADMQADAVQQLIRRLSVAKRPG
jgi:LPS-assembly lipoprotein